MNIIGISGGYSFLHEYKYTEHFLEAHDSAAVLVCNGKVVAAHEEERLNRIKHTNKSPIGSIQSCLAFLERTNQKIDKVAVYATERGLDSYLLYDVAVKHMDLPINTSRELYTRALEYGSSQDNQWKDKFVYVAHHLAHASSAYYLSGFEDSLIISIDGSSSEGNSGLIMSATKDGLKELGRLPNSISLGKFYEHLIGYVGYSRFDEYKVMGLAPYGNPSKFRRIFKKLYSLMDRGEYTINYHYFDILFDVIQPRRKHESFTQVHKDFAAALQEALETIVLHILQHYRKETGHNKLCLAGGVAHNCTMNGKILSSGLFDDMFVQPAAHDAGCALGAALYVAKMEDPGYKNDRLQHVYWGTSTGNQEQIETVLTSWRRFLAFEKSNHVTKDTAELLASDYVIGWVQGRSEFGPRALGNRSILADPRPEENKNRINRMIKKREGYRPFAPSILEGYLTKYYIVPESHKQFPFMNYVVHTVEDKRKELGAVTHVDGTARIQTVSKETNPRYWELIEEFRKQTGVPILLNTSFNNNVEPIVDSVEDAIVCFLTTQLDRLVVGDYIIKKKEVSLYEYLELKISIPAYVEVNKTYKHQNHEESGTYCDIRVNYDRSKEIKISNEVYELLVRAHGATLREVLDSLGINDHENVKQLLEDIIDLWNKRVVVLEP